MTTKQELHQLVESLPEEQLAAAARLLAELAETTAEVPADEETAAWLSADLSRMADIEPFEWGPAGKPPGRPLKYVPSRGLVIE